MPRTILTRLLIKPALLWDRLKGDRRLRLISQHHSPEEAYTIHANNGGVIKLYCIESIYQLSYSRCWAKAKQHRTYRVYGVCDEKIPKLLIDKLAAGISIGNLLPESATRIEQKQAVIQASISMISSEIEAARQQLKRQTK